MIWGNFKICDGIHTAPCTPCGFVLPGHELSPLCECKPTPEWTVGYRTTVWIHHDNH